MSTHGRHEELVYFAQLIQDWDKLLDHWLAEKNWLASIDVLSRQSRGVRFFKSAGVLMEHAPEETVNLWIRQNNLNPRHLIPALLKYNNTTGNRVTQLRVIFYVALRRLIPNDL